MRTKIKEFTEDLKKRDKSQHTILAYERNLLHFLTWYQSLPNSMNDDPEIHHIGPLDISEYKKFLESREHKVSTIKQHISAIKQFFQWAAKKKYIDYDPTNDIVLPEEVTAPGPKALMRHEKHALVRAAERKGNIRNLAIVALLLHTGIRPDELRKIHMKHITIKERSGSVEIRKGKRSFQRTVPLNNTVRKILLRYIENERGWGEGPLFPSKRSRKEITTRQIERIVRDIAYDAKLEHVTPYTLRHTFATDLINANIPINRVAVLMGHRSLNTTKRYTMPSQRDLEQDVEVLSWN